MGAGRRQQEGRSRPVFRYNAPVLMVTRARSIAAVAVLLQVAVAATQPAPRLTPDQQREFLLKARIVSSRPVGIGVTGSLRLTLTDGTTTHDAGFQSIEQRSSNEDIRQGRKRAGELRFADSYKFNLAAYELARLLGLDDMMPVTVERRYRGQIGSLTWWIDDVLMDENEREKTNAIPPSPVAFSRQRQRMFVFAELVRDTDRNKGNVIYTKDWRVIMIDFTRAFRIDRELRNPDMLQQCDRGLFERLQTLTRNQIEDATEDYLTGAEIAGVVARRQLIVERYERLIRERGEKAILY
jgi:hypothetical protein